MKRHISILICGLFFSCLAWAIESPVVMLKQTSNEMVAALKKNHAKIKADPNVVYQLAEKILVPDVDITAMSRLALGRQHWMAATEQQHKQFEQVFMTLMIRTYASALSNYTDEEIRFQPLRVDPNKNQRVKVDSLIVQHGGPSIPVSYRLHQKNGQWKIYDLTVDGVSMVHSFHSQFANEIARGGMDGLLQAMRQHAKQVSQKAHANS